MNERTKTGLLIVQVALVMGVLGDVLLRATPWGLNVLLFNAAFAGGMIMLLKRRAPERLNAQTLSLFGALIFFASMFVWRDSIEMRVADTFAIIAILSVLFVPKLNVAPNIAGAFHYAVGFVWSALNAVFAPLALLIGDIEWQTTERAGWRKHLFSTLRGVAIATPLLVIFGALFVAADAAYEGMVMRVLNVEFETIFTHVLLFGLFSWLSAGYLRGAIINVPNPISPFVTPETPSVVPEEKEGSRVDRVRAESGEYPVTLPDNRSAFEHLNISDPPNAKEKEKETQSTGSETDPEPKPDPEIKTDKPKWNWATIDNTMFPQAFTLGRVEVGVILGLMNLLFLSFVIIQVPYLFGGMDLVQNTPDFKLAEYARRGFGELVAVSALVLPTLLIGQWLIRKNDNFAQNLFRILAGSQIVLLFVIMASAVQRLVLLTGNLGYGMTTVRLYPLIFMTWLAVVFVWFGVTVMRGARQYFAWGALWSAFFILGATHVLNPDEFIVKTNLALMRQGRSFDARYNASLSQDAIPTLITSLNELSLRDQCHAKRVLWGLRSGRNEQDNRDIRSWNISRSRANSLLTDSANLGLEDIAVDSGGRHQCVQVFDQD